MRSLGSRFIAYMVVTLMALGVAVASPTLAEEPSSSPSPSESSTPEPSPSDSGDPAASPEGSSPPDPADTGWIDETVGEPVGDPGDIVDEIWELDPLPDDLNCDARVSDGPRLNNNGLIVGQGTFDCHESVLMIDITVCLHYRSAGTWEPMGCRHDESSLYVQGDSADATFGVITRKIKEPCIAGQTKEYRLRVKGHALDGTEDRDAAKATATYFCPFGELTADGAAEYALDLGSLE